MNGVYRLFHVVFAERFQPFAVNTYVQYSDLKVTGSNAVFRQNVSGAPKYHMQVNFVNQAQNLVQLCIVTNRLPTSVCSNKR